MTMLVVVLLFLYSAMNMITALFMVGQSHTLYVGPGTAFIVILAHVGYILLVLSLL